MHISSYSAEQVRIANRLRATRDAEEVAREDAGLELGRSWASDEATEAELQELDQIVNSYESWLEVNLLEGHSLLKYASGFDPGERLELRGDRFAQDDPYRRGIARGHSRSSRRSGRCCRNFETTALPPAKHEAKA